MESRKHHAGSDTDLRRRAFQWTSDLLILIQTLAFAKRLVYANTIISGLRQSSYFKHTRFMLLEL